MFFKLIKKIYLAYSRKDYNLFLKSLHHPNEAQNLILEKIIYNLNHSVYGQKFGEIKNKNEFKAKIPIVKYDDIRELIKKQKDEKTPILTPKTPSTYEFTSGSSGAPKPIPYTKELLNSFEKLFIIWSHDILLNAPMSIDFGKTYISVSPLVGEHKGLDDDRDYLSGLTQKILSPYWIGHQLKQITKLEDYPMALAITLLSQAKLEIISIWSPSLLIKNLSFIEDNKKEIIKILESGFYQSDKFILNFSPLTYSLDTRVEDFFPSLKFISSWGSAGAKNDYKLLKKIFPKVYIQEKGLLATESPLTLPLIKADNLNLPLIEDVFFEFLDNEGKIYDLESVEEGKLYELIFSQLGGLYRYRLGDMVKIGPFYKNTPTISFMGRAGIISDLCGEKLSEEELQILFADFDEDFFIFPNKDHYLVLGLKEGQSKKVDEVLMQSPHYKYARIAGQLQQCQCIAIIDLKSEALNYFTQVKGLKHGDIKLQKLYPKDSDVSFLNFLRKKAR